MAKAKSIRGLGDGDNGENLNYMVDGRGKVSRAKLVSEIKQGKHPDTGFYTRGGVEYGRNNPNDSKFDNIDD